MKDYQDSAPQQLYTEVYCVAQDDVQQPPPPPQLLKPQPATVAQASSNTDSESSFFIRGVLAVNLFKLYIINSICSNLLLIIFAKKRLNHSGKLNHRGISY